MGCSGLLREGRLETPWHYVGDDLGRYFRAGQRTSLNIHASNALIFA